jgi:hypothetical protein
VNKIPGRCKEEILFKIWSDGWDKEMPVKLITYSNGTRDLHCQTGDHIDKAIEKAKEALKERGLKIVGDAGDWEFIGPSGAYYRVEEI